MSSFYSFNITIFDLFTMHIKPNIQLPRNRTVQYPIHEKPYHAVNKQDKVAETIRYNNTSTERENPHPKLEKPQKNKGNITPQWR